jgi:hypothetical protein
MTDHLPAAFPSVVYLLCFLTSATCAALLLRGYARAGGGLLFWSGLCFALLAVNNFVVIADLLIFPDLDLNLVRLAASLLAVSVLLFGFIWRGDEA